MDTLRHCKGFPIFSRILPEDNTMSAVHALGGLEKRWDTVTQFQHLEIQISN